MGRREEDEWGSDGGIADDWELELEEEEQRKKETLVPKEPKAKPKPKVPQPEIVENEMEKKQRLEQAVKRSDLRNTMDLFGIAGAEVDIEDVLRSETAGMSIATSTNPGKGQFEVADPQTIPEFEKYAEYVSSHLNSAHASHKYYHTFLDCLIKQLLQPRDLSEVRKMISVLQDIQLLKQKEQKAAGPSAAANAAAAAAAAAQQAQKKKPILLATKKGRELDMTDYGSVCYDDEDY